jgi:Cys-tRNA(Pro) deacylase
MGKERTPSTSAVRTLKRHGVRFVLASYKYEEKGGTRAAAEQLNVDEHQVIKTIAMEDDTRCPFLVLMHGDKRISTKALARTLGVKAVKPCDSEVAHKHTGYLVGGMSPFGTRKPLRVYVEASILELPKIYINAGKRGLLAEMAPGDLANILRPLSVSVAL